VKARALVVEEGGNSYHGPVRVPHSRRRALGQHWLVDCRTLACIARAADFTADDTVVEVGAGTGLLTRSTELLQSLLLSSRGSVNKRTARLGRFRI
jgi:hypothetical protein